MAQITMCTTLESIREAFDLLSKSAVVILDCEGQDLGSSVGTLSLISLGTPESEAVYLIDAISVDNAALQTALGQIVSNRSITKVVWDGRMDYSELFFGFSTPMENVLDLQIVDIISRSSTYRQESGYKTMRRLSRWDFPEKEVRKLELEGMHALNSMNSAIREHNIIGAPRKDGELLIDTVLTISHRVADAVKKIHAENRSSMWMSRPLSDVLLQYAAGDITRISALYKHFKEKGYLDDLPRLLEISQRYVSMHQLLGRPDQSNKFLRCGVLPLNILDCVLSDSGSVIMPGSIDTTCEGCHRLLMEEHFPVQGPTKKEGVGTSKGRERMPTCKVCTYILAKEKYIAKSSNFSEAARPPSRAPNSSDIMKMLFNP